jgi:hypothetical protein
MRKIPLLPLALLLTGPLGALAVDGTAITSDVPPTEPRAPVHPWSVSVGTGGGSFFEFVDAFAGSGPPYEQRQRDRLQLNLRVDRELGRRLRAGLAYTYLGWTDTYSSGGVPVTGTIDERSHVLMADVTVLWYRSEHVETYSALAAGYGTWRATGTVAGARYDDVQSGPAFQLRYFGLSVGNERFRAFADLGLGFEGLIVAGVTLRL